MDALEQSQSHHIPRTYQLAMCFLKFIKIASVGEQFYTVD